jgi:hypothetical protein
MSRLILFFLVTLMVTPTFAMFHAYRCAPGNAPGYVPGNTPVHAAGSKNKAGGPLTLIIMSLTEVIGKPSDFKFRLNNHMPAIKAYKIFLSLGDAIGEKLNLYEEMTNLECLVKGYEDSDQKRKQAIDFLEKVRELSLKSH